MELHFVKKPMGKNIWERLFIFKGIINAGLENDISYSHFIGS
jgi:hypothetical protein